MINKKIVFILVILVLLVSLSGCVPVKKFTTGSFDGVTYTNDYFGLTFDIPEGWKHASKEEIAEAFQLTAEWLNMKEEDLEKKQSVYLVYISKHPFGYEDFNANMNINCINLGLSGMLSYKKGEDLLQASIEMIDEKTEGTELSYTFGEIHTETIGGADFAMVDAELNAAGYLVKQRMLCTLRNKYALVLSLSWVDEADLKEMQDMIDSIRFE